VLRGGQKVAVTGAINHLCIDRMGEGGGPKRIVALRESLMLGPRGWAFAWSVPVGESVREPNQTCSVRRIFAAILHAVWIVIEHWI